MSFVQVDIFLDLVTLAMTLVLWVQINRQYQNLITLKCLMNNKDHDSARATASDTADRIDQSIRRQAPPVANDNCVMTGGRGI